MAQRKIRSVKVGRCTVTIYRNVEWDEYRVVGKIGSKVIGGKSGGGYFTDDKQDARNNAALFVRNLRKRPACHVR